MKIGVLESNGHQNYKNWDLMKSYHLCADGKWIQVKDGVFELDNDFYRQSGGIFKSVNKYLDMVE